MTLIVAWIVFPAVLLALSAGCGALVERLARVTLPGPVVPSIGLAAMVVATQACTYWDATAELAVPVVIVLAVAGLVAGRDRLRALRPDWWALGAAAGVFAVFAAPVFLSGDPTFAGYGVLGDTSIHFVLIDRLMEHGRDVSDLAPSSYKSALEGYFGTAYPTGAHTALGAARPLVGQDVAWVFQPYLAVLMALTAGLLYQLAGSVVRPRFARAAIAFVAAQPALVFAYSLQGSIKEIATVWAIALLVALVPLVVGARAQGLWRLVPVAVAIAAALEVLGLAIAPWLGPLLVATLAALLWQRRRAGWRPTAVEAAVAGAAAVVLAFPVFLRAKTFVSATEGVVTAPSEVGNLFGPLHKVQALGIWPSGDYRFSPDPGRVYDATYVLIGVVAAACVLGVAWCVRRRAWLPLLFLGVSLIGWGYATARGSPWVDAKALMIVSTPLVFTAMLGAAALVTGGRRPEGALLAAAIAGGVLWSNALAYHDVSLAPRDRLEELASVGDRVEGRGRCCTRSSRSTASTSCARVTRRAGRRRGSPARREARSPRMWTSTRFRRTWCSATRRSCCGARRPQPAAGAVSAHPFRRLLRDMAAAADRGRAGPGASAARHHHAGCREAALRRSARSARRARGGMLAYVERPRAFVVVPARGRLPVGWGVDGTDPNAVRPVGAGRIAQPLEAARTEARHGWAAASGARCPSASTAAASGASAMS